MNDKQDHIVDVIECGNKAEYFLIMGARIVIFVLSGFIALISINVQHEYYLYFTMDIQVLAFIVASVFVLMTIVLFEYYTFLKVRNKNSSYVFRMFVICMVFIALGTFSGSYIFSQKTKNMNVKTISKEDNKREKWADLIDKKERKDSEYKIKVNEFSIAESNYNSSHNSKDAKELKVAYLTAKYAMLKSSKELDVIISNKEALLTENPDLNLDKGQSRSQNKDVFEFLSFGVLPVDLVRGAMMFFGVIILDLFAPFMLSLAIFRIQPVLIRKKEENILFPDIKPLDFDLKTKADIDKYTKETYSDFGLSAKQKIDEMEGVLTVQFKEVDNNEKEMVTYKKSDVPYIKNNIGPILSFIDSLLSGGLNPLKDLNYCKEKTGIEENKCKAIFEILQGMHIQGVDIFSINSNGTYKSVFSGAVIKKILMKIANK